MKKLLLLLLLVPALVRANPLYELQTESGRMQMLPGSLWNYQSGSRLMISALWELKTGTTVSRLRVTVTGCYAPFGSMTVAFEDGSSRDYDWSVSGERVYDSVGWRMCYLFDPKNPNMKR